MPAFWGTRRSLLGATQSVQTPFSPADVSGLIGWWKADALNLADGAAVSSWTDSSSQNNPLAQATGGSQPTFQTNQLNGKPIVRFNGSKFMSSSSAIGANTAMTWFIVAKSTGYTSVNRVCGIGAQVSIFNFNPNWSYYSNEGAGVVGFGAASTSWHIVTINFASLSSASAFVDGGSAVATWDPFDFNINTSFNMGCEDNGGTNAFIGDVAEAIFYNVAISGANQTLVQNYLGTKYGITVT